MTKIGDRVGAALGAADDGTIELIGYGVYVGNEIPHEKVAWVFADAARDIGMPNPKIQLDSGQDVFGCECYWGPEERLRSMVEKYGFTEVDIDEVRKAYAVEAAMPK